MRQVRWRIPLPEGRSRKMALPGAVLASGLAIAVTVVAWGPGTDSSVDASDSTSSSVESETSLTAGWESDPAEGTAAVVPEGDESEAVELALSSYDASSHEAVLSSKETAEETATPQPTAAQQISVGDVVASAPSIQAPRGALFKVAKIVATENGDVRVVTEEATLDEILGAQEITRIAEASALDISLESLIPGLQVLSAAPITAADESDSASATADPVLPPATLPTPPTLPGLPTLPPAPTLPSLPGVSTESLPGVSVEPLPSASGTHTTQVVEQGEIVRPTRQPDGGILLSVELPDSVMEKVGMQPSASGSDAQMAAWAGLTPKLLFEYGKKVSDTDPFAAEIGIAGQYSYGWMVHGKLAGEYDTGEEPLQIPLATLHYRTTEWIGPVPLVISADVTYFYRISASGELSIDAEQSTTGMYALGGHYEDKTGWEPFNRNNSTTTKTPDTIKGHGQFKATIGTDMSFYLFDAIGLEGRIAPYLQINVDVGKAVSPGLARLQLFIGIDCTGSFNFKLAIFGITLVDEEAPFPATHEKWKLVDEMIPRT